MSDQAKDAIRQLIAAAQARYEAEQHPHRHRGTPPDPAPRTIAGDHPKEDT